MERLLPVGTIRPPRSAPLLTPSLPPSRSLSAVVGRSHSFDRAPNEIRAFAALKERARFGRRRRARGAEDLGGECRGGEGVIGRDRSRWQRLTLCSRKAVCPTSASNRLVNETHKLLQPSSLILTLSCVFYRGNFSSRHALFCEFLILKVTWREKT